MMKHDRPPQKVTVEDLLRLKRAERPPAEFWAKFESDLRAKQLAAIVDKHPWWHVMPRAFAGVARLHLPVGATAIMAITVFTIGGYRVASVDRSEPSVAPAPQLVNSNAASSAQLAAVPPMAAPTLSDEQPTLNSGETSSNVVLSAPASLSSDAEQNSARAIIGRNLDKKLAEAQQVAIAELPASITRDRAFEVRSVAARIKNEPLAQVRTPADDRRERYLGRSLPGDYALEAGFQPTMRSSGGLNRQYNERRFHESDEISRFGAHGAGVSIKL